jgi:serralysin
MGGSGDWSTAAGNSGMINVGPAAITARLPNVFLKGGSGTKALTVTSGQNVLDGGMGSAFLAGGSGTDTSFVDVRNSNAVWNTLTNFHVGGAVMVWGRTPGAGTETVAAQAGAAGYQGATLSLADGQGGGASDVTFAGLSASQVAHLQASTGSVGGIPYLYFYNPGA